MKYFFLTFVFLIFSLNSFSSTFRSQIHSIDLGKANERHLIMLTNGRTAFLAPKSKTLIEAAEQSLQNGDTVEMTLDSQLNLISIQTVAPEVQLESEDLAPREMMSYVPSVISLATAQSVFQGMRRDYQNQSQCYNRAHIWTYEAFKRNALRSNKLFLFFTTRYIRKYNFYWWFHVTPMAYVGGTTQPNWRTLDRRYTSGPLSTKTWTDIFMRNDALCPVVYTYSSYRNHQQEQYCYLIPTSMYFWQPYDILRQETTGYVKTLFFSSQINAAYQEAF